MLPVLLADGLPRCRGNDLDRQRPSNRVAHPKGLGEVQAGVQEDDVDAGDDARHDMGEHGVGHRTGHAEPLAELVGGPLDDALRGRPVEAGVGVERKLAQFLGASAGLADDRQNRVISALGRRLPGNEADEFHRESPCARPALPRAVAVLVGRRSSSPQYGQ